MTAQLTPDQLAERVTVIDVDHVTLLEGNPNRADMAALDRSIEEFGQVATILVDNGVVVDGNHRVLNERERRRFGGRLAAIDITGLDWTEARAAAAGLGLNITARLGSDDPEALRRFLQRIADDDLALLRALSYQDDFTPFPADDPPPAGGPPPDPDDTPDVPTVPISKVGDVWLIGPHRVVCGDSGDPAVLAEATDGQPVGCLLTDPPYGMRLNTDYSKIKGSKKATLIAKGRKYEPVIGDDSDFDAGPTRRFFADTREQFWWGADYYRRTLSPADNEGSWLVWDKRNDASDDIVGSGFELCWSARKHQRRMLRHFWVGAMGPADARERQHPTQKPVALLADILTRWAPDGCVVADPYAGSGSTAVAAATTGRAAVCVELSPAYVDVIVQRLHHTTRLIPVLASTGDPYPVTVA